MKLLKTCLLFIILIFISTEATSQVEYRENFWGGKYYQNGNKVKKLKDAESILQPVNAAHQEFLKGKMNANIAIISSVGGLVVEVYALSKILNAAPGEDGASLGLTLGGLGLLGLSYYFDRQSARQFGNAAAIYNRGDIGLNIRPGLSKNGIGLLVTLK